MSESLALFLVLIATVAAVMCVFALVRSLTGRRDDELLPALDGEEGPASLVLPELPPNKTLSDQVDRKFDTFVSDTGLGLTSAQGLGYIALCAVVGAAVPMLFRNDPLQIGIGLLIGLMIPIIFFMIAKARYRRSIQDQLPDAVYLIARSLRAGQNLEQSMATVARYGTQPLAREFKWVVEQTDLGLNVTTALQGMAKRLRITDFNIFVTAVSLYRNIGGNLAILLERVAISIRDRNLFRGYFRAATSLGRITGFVIALAPLLILAAYAIWQPEFVAKLTETPQGLRALTFAAVLEVIGIVWLYWLLRVDY